VDIKQAYHRVAKECHPDKVGKTKSVQKAGATWFRTVQNAYDVLSNPETRRQYDRNREAT